MTSNNIASDVLEELSYLFYLPKEWHGFLDLYVLNIKAQLQVQYFVRETQELHGLLHIFDQQVPILLQNFEKIILQQPIVHSVTTKHLAEDLAFYFDKELLPHDKEMDVTTSIVTYTIRHLELHGIAYWSCHLQAHFEPALHIVVNGKWNMLCNKICKTSTASDHNITYYLHNDAIPEMTICEPFVTVCMYNTNYVNVKQIVPFEIHLPSMIEMVRFNWKIYFKFKQLHHLLFTRTAMQTPIVQIEASHDDTHVVSKCASLYIPELFIKLHVREAWAQLNSIMVSMRRHQIKFGQKFHNNERVAQCTLDSLRQFGSWYDALAAMGIEGTRELKDIACSMMQYHVPSCTIKLKHKELCLKCHYVEQYAVLYCDKLPVEFFYSKSKYDFYCRLRAITRWNNVTFVFSSKR